MINIEIIVHKEDNVRTKEILLNENYVLNSCDKVVETESLCGTYAMWEVLTLNDMDFDAMVVDN